ncbi:zinc finger, GRF-type [Artemisia annua]|uniref:Zinc finger, GRF-type n=1 Tax=Artemisia annua TaxID=35608 RepID=A0A2U1NDK8_ARTAN|nr:zinc finger, GRF-type [Artemisia annua]PWA84155.1 zinc finger, GRF-type [Artemisia annua]
MVNCFCGLQCAIRTSWTDVNPGRRFFSCPRDVPNCGFFEWCDPPMCPRSVVIIPGLLRARNAHQQAMNGMVAQNRKLKMMLVCTWIVFAMYWFM